MSWTSGAASALGFRHASGRRDTNSRSPVVAFRESPMAYEPPKMCHRKPARKAPRWISWSSQNLGRRYYACVDAMHGGCGFVEWHDDPLPKFFSDLIGDLRDEVRRLKGRGFVARIEGSYPNVPLSGHEATLESAGSVMSLHVQLEDKNVELKAMKSKYMNLLMLFIVFVLGVVLGKMLVY